MSHVTKVIMSPIGILSKSLVFMELEILNMEYLTKLISLISLEIHCSVEQMSIFLLKNEEAKSKKMKLMKSKKMEFWNFLFKVAKACKLTHQKSPITLDYECFFLRI